ncbi:ABC transporter ATP-binding protein [Weissella hellenica]|uniref:ABC transport system ATP-binding protein n=1 Tax=Weissella hellenica TaxID=46256 RepID=A0A4Y4G3M1_WEIHE|nr:ABC transporter ATP-binding protein [Weissella hellenica]NKY67320.1 ABC transporter ATP-binding protein [Weissella hellenica]GED36313.1 ABC transporter ATP-binding protein [Weissella hellenica]SCC02145.1 putative ABC transport system ATP-binding protein [Weissella hellenica]
MIKLEAINKSYQQGKSAVHILHDINLNISEGELVAIMGQSGSGKSTLINIIGFLDDQFEGNYFYNDLPIHDYKRSQFSKLRNSNVGFVFQNFKLINNLTVQENVGLPLLYAGEKRTNIKKRVTEVLQQVGLPGLEKELPKNLSGGQQQRVSIARAIITHPQFLIADEPTGALDSQTSAEIIALFKQLNKQRNTTIIMVTHDEKVCRQATRLIQILDGRIISDEKVV